MVSHVSPVSLDILFCKGGLSNSNQVPAAALHNRGSALVYVSVLQDDLIGLKVWSKLVFAELSNFITGVSTVCGC